MAHDSQELVPAYKAIHPEAVMARGSMSEICSRMPWTERFGGRSQQRDRLISLNVTGLMLSPFLVS